MVRVVRWAGVIVIIVLMMTGQARAQATTGSIFGKTTDASGAVLPNVIVTVSGTGLLQPVRVATGESGAYQIPGVPIGIYRVTFTLNGFRTLIRDGIRLTTDANAQIDARMEIGIVEAEITITADSPIVDTRSPKTGATFTREVLEAIPTARDPLQIMNMTPGIIMQNSNEQPSGVNVAGSSSGQQMSPSFRGAGSGNTQWNMDGGTITDMSASGAAPIYFDFNAFEEIQITTGAADVSQQTGGININLITRSGSNLFKGTGQALFANKDLQSQNVTEELFNRGSTASSGVSGAPMKLIVDDGVEYGGPIRRNRLWVWGAFGYQKIDLGILGFYDTARADCNPAPTTFDALEKNQDCLKGDTTIIKNSNAKTNFQLSNSHKFQFLYQNSNKIRNARGADSDTLLEATTRQYSPGGSWQVNGKHTWVLTDRLMVENQILYVHNFFNLDFQDYDNGCAYSVGGAFPSNPGCLFNTQRFVNRDLGVTGRSASASFFERPEVQARSDANYFIASALGGDHSIKIGAAWREYRSNSYTHNGGFADARYMTRGGVFGPDSAILRRDSHTRSALTTWSAYAQDSYNRGRLRLTGGVRWDLQDDRIFSSCVPASPLAPARLAAQCTDPYDSPVDFNDIAPRLSATLDLFGDGRTAAKASYAMYFAQGVGTSSVRSNTGGVTLTFGFPSGSNTSRWTDANGDRIVQPEELTGTPPFPNRYNPATGQLDPNVNQVDPGLKSARTREAVVGVEHELMPNVGISVDYIWRKYDRGSRDYIIGGVYPPSDVFVGPLNYTDPVSGRTSTYWQVCATCARQQGPEITRNTPNYTTFHGVEISAEKRFSHRWRASTSITLSQAKDFQELGGYADPTNRDKTHGQDGGNSNIRYVFKALGHVELPWLINAAANLNVQDGFIRTIVITGPSGRFGGLNADGTPFTLPGQPNLELFTRGTNRLPGFAELDLGFSRPFGFRGGRTQITVKADIFNTLNISTIRGLQNNMSQVNFDRVTAIVPPRVVRLGLLVRF
ncbi:MAG TPA: TonB-dependent receptor [Vicinamibacterales bacterium]